ncbi:hypothetical protein [Nocardiopsis ansamitocini]|uniref:DNA-directed RNA polymerase specialized sigma24 family protein n=1 Tax=Nocardiopsis ansamitocini TaxID=1670832 RepID=A0A9W6P449_9ACTN|nr:hypothetical protein [Nocardiopsis ansamitocini]GLU46673.1 hypothetical protein Nans01_10240 [Nocardiopsis ansamitocini]
MSTGRNIPPGQMRAYRDLARIAYLVLPGRSPDQGRLYQAHRIVTAVLAGRGDLDPGDYDVFRVRVLRRALRPKRWWQRRTAWLRMFPATGFSDDIALFAALDELTPQGRAAYVLSRIEQIPPDEVRDVLQRSGAVAPDAAITEAAGVGGRLAASETEQDRLLERPPFDPTIVRVYGRRSSARPTAAAATVGVALILVAIVAIPQVRGGTVLRHETGAAPAAAHSTQVRVLAAQTWRERFELDLSAWDARGDLLDDDRLVQRALAAWYGIEEPGSAGRGREGAEALAPSAAPLLLFAGEVDGHRVVLLHDAPRLARYVEGADRAAVEVFPEPGNGVANWPAVRLLATDEGVRFLLPPWVVQAETAPLAEDGPQWSSLRIDDGVTDHVPTVREPGCARGQILRLRAPDVAHGQPYTVMDGGWSSTSHIGYMPPPPAEIRRLGPHELTGDPTGFKLWGELDCVLPPLDRPARTSTVWEFAVTDLPGGGSGRWTCTRFGFADGTGSAVVTLLASQGRTRQVEVATHENGWDCSNLSRQVAAGAWWQDDDGAWHYLAGASRDAVSIRVEGAVTGTGEGPQLAVTGPPAGEKPAGAVTVTAVNAEGQKMTVFE